MTPGGLWAGEWSPIPLVMTMCVLLPLLGLALFLRGRRERVCLVGVMLLAGLVTSRVVTVGGVRRGSGHVNTRRPQECHDTWLAGLQACGEGISANTVSLLVLAGILGILAVVPARQRVVPTQTKPLTLE